MILLFRFMLNLAICLLLGTPAIIHWVGWLSHCESLTIFLIFSFCSHAKEIVAVIMQGWYILSSCWSQGSNPFHKNPNNWCFVPVHAWFDRHLNQPWYSKTVEACWNLTSSTWISSLSVFQRAPSIYWWIPPL